MGPWNLLPPPQIFALIVFSSLLTDGYQNKTDSSQLRCVLNSNNAACSFAVGAGLLALLSCLVFLALDAHEGHIACTRFRTAFQLLDFILAGEPGPLPAAPSPPWPGDPSTPPSPAQPATWNPKRCPALLTLTAPAVSSPGNYHSVL